MNKTLYIIIPCYNEETVIYETAKRLLHKMEELSTKISDSSRIVFVNDGSTDQTWTCIQELHNNNKVFSGIRLSRNRGHQNALLAGLMAMKEYCDLAISMDADLQDDIDVIDQMLEQFENGADIVYGVRNKRTTDTFFKRFTAESFYKLMSSLGVETVYNHADYRLMSKRALYALAEFQEVNLFLRGIIPLIGFNTSYVYYERQERFAGESKYPLKKMLAFAFEGITSFSTKPIRFILALGTAIFTISIFMMVHVIWEYFTGGTIPGWASIMTSVWGIGGLLILSVGIVGEYIGKIYLESKRRPRYIIDEILNQDHDG